jgi:hypothetical protein
MVIMNKKESSQRSIKEDKSLEEIKQSMINSLKDIQFCIVMDRIAVVQDRLYSVLLYLPTWRNLILRRTEKIEEAPEMDPRVQGVMEASYDQTIWERVYSKTDERIVSSDAKEMKSIQQIRQSMWDSLKQMEFDIIRNDCAPVEDRVASALIYLHEWRRLLPEKARPITTYWEWVSKRCEEIELEAIGNSIKDSGRIKGLIDGL